MAASLEELENRIVNLESKIDDLQKIISSSIVTNKSGEAKGTVKGSSSPSFGAVMALVFGILILLSSVPSLISRIFLLGSRSYYYSSFSITNLLFPLIGLLLVGIWYRSYSSSKQKVKTTTAHQVKVDASTVKASPLDVAVMKSINPEKSGNVEFNIASNWFAIIGIVAIIFGVGFFLKFAFDNGLIGPRGQVTIGVISGLILLGIGDFFRTKYKDYSEIITGGGIVVLYLSIWAAYSLFELIGVYPVLGAVSLITVLSTLLAIRYEAVGVGLIGVIGGLGAPTILSKGFDSSVVLMMYIVILDFGVLSVGIFKHWQVLSSAAFILSYFNYFVWYSSNYSDPLLSTALAFLSVLFLIFGLVTYLYCSLNKQKVTDADVLLMSLNGIFYFLAVYQLIVRLYDQYSGFLAFGLALFYFLVGNLSFKQYSKDASLTIAHLGLSILFLTITIPLQVDGTVITLAWASEAAILIYLGFFIGSYKLRVAGLLIFILVAARLLVFESSIKTTEFVLLINKRFMIYMFSAGALAISGYFYKHFSKLITDDEKKILPTLLIMFNLVVLAALSMESNSYYSQQITAGRNSAIVSSQGRIMTAPPFENSAVNNRNSSLNQIQLNQQRSRDLESARDVTLSIIWILYAIVLIVAGLAFKYKPIRLTAIALFSISVLKVFLVDSRYLQTPYRIIAFVVLGSILLTVSLIYRKYKNKIEEFLL